MKTLQAFKYVNTYVHILGYTLKYPFKSFFGTSICPVKSLVFLSSSLVELNSFDFSVNLYTYIHKCYNYVAVHCCENISCMTSNSHYANIYTYMYIRMYVCICMYMYILTSCYKFLTSHLLLLTLFSLFQYFC